MPDSETQELTIAQIFEKLCIADDIILDDLPAHQLVFIRRGISSYKTKQNAALKRNDLPLEDRRIEYEVLEEKPGNMIKVRIHFIGAKTFSMKVINADGELK